MSSNGESLAPGHQQGAVEADGAPPRVTLVVNGTDHLVPPGVPLLSVLRGQLGLTGAKPGCGEGACGSCTVLVDGRAVRACQQKVDEIAGASVTTIEGLADKGRLHPVQEAFVELGAVQCGYCTPGMVLSAVALLARDPLPDDSAVDEALSGNLCRCGVYTRVRKAVHRAVELTTQPGTSHGSPVTATTGDWKLADPCRPGYRPARPWDMTEPAERDYFGVLGDGLVVVLPPETPAAGTWSTSGGAWLHAGTDGVVTAFTGKVDVGQDNRTALRLLVAEELRVPLENVRLAMGDTDLCPYDMGTFGSRSMPDAGGALRRVAAFARDLEPAAAGERRIEIVTGEPAVTRAPQWQIAGSPRVPAGTVDAVSGTLRYVSDLGMPGLWHGCMLRPPVFRSQLAHVDTSALDGRSDVVVVKTPVGVGVLARDRMQARMALGLLTATWEIPKAPSDDDLEEFLRSHPLVGGDGWNGPFHHEQGDAAGAFEAAAVRVDASYTTAFVAPAPLEMRVALACFDGGRLTIWTGTQTPFPVRAEVAAALNMDEQDVRVIVPPTGGGFGGKHAGGVATEAAMLARAVGAPVRVGWTRREEFSAGSLRPAAVMDVKAGATSDGVLSAWTFTNINSGRAAIATPYRVANQRIDYQPAVSPLAQASFRALAATANNFARESHMDEVAYRLGRDPVEFRLAHLGDERLAPVLRAAAERFGWTTVPENSGRGIACGLEKDGRVATAAQVAIGPDGFLRVIHLVTAYECGAVVNPDTVLNQIEGATVVALGGALFEAVHFDAGAITNGTCTDYRIPRISDVPPIEVVLLDRPDLPSAGAGETPMIAVAPAIANAIFDATGRRLRSLPLTRDGYLDRDG
ncbi:MAG: molybdopterin cofactor-binding domain-containing protein [Acidimicrobiales bacterium]